MIHSMCGTEDLWVWHFLLHFRALSGNRFYWINGQMMQKYVQNAVYILFYFFFEFFRKKKLIFVRMVEMMKR